MTRTKLTFDLTRLISIMWTLSSIWGTASWAISHEHTHSGIAGTQGELLSHAGTTQAAEQDRRVSGQWRFPDTTGR